jgi:DNA-binding LacI/PurR family transcriptional regulator
MLARMKVPIVLIDNQHPGEFVHSVMIDNVLPAATRSMIDLGHRRIAHLGDQFGFQSDHRSIQWLSPGIAAGRLPFLPELVVHGNGSADGESGDEHSACPPGEAQAVCSVTTTCLHWEPCDHLSTMDSGFQGSVPGGFDDLPIASYVSR